MEWIKYILKAIIIIVLQVLVFDRLQIQAWGYPMVYVLLLLILPTQLPRWAEMLIGMIVGLIMDVCNNSLGVHMAACVALSFFRPILLRKSSQDIERIKGEISSLNIGMIEYMKCALILVVMHHFMVFMLEAWSLHNWWMIILQTLLSSILTLLVILGYEIIRR
jgi:rod shape-determining protein MreD